MYEGSGRYKDVRELYESKLEAKETELMSAKEQALQGRLTGEQKDREMAAKLAEIENLTKESQASSERMTANIQNLEKQIQGHKEEISKLSD